MIQYVFCEKNSQKLSNFNINKHPYTSYMRKILVFVALVFDYAYYKNGKHSCNKIKSYSRLKSSIIAHLYLICGLIKLKMLNLALFDSFKNQRHYLSTV